MIHYHVFWSKPHLGRQGHDASLELTDFELLTWITSTLEIRRHSPIHLVTDSDGAAFIRGSGMGGLYDGIRTDLDDMPAGIDSRIFWDGGKMFWFQRLETPCVVLDYDAILWRPLETSATVLALHEEERSWSFYAPNREKFERFGFRNGGWNWEANPVNTALVYFSEPALPHGMGKRSVEFMQDYSDFASTAGPEERLTVPKYNRATLFAGQRLLGMCAARHGLQMQFLTTLHPCLLTLRRNPTCTHLWISKALYRCIPEAREALANHLIDHLTTLHPGCRELLSDFGLAEPLTIGPDNRMDFRMLSPSDARRQQLRRMRECSGEVTIEDANVPLVRPGFQGAHVLPGEVVHVPGGASCELVSAEDD